MNFRDLAGVSLRFEVGGHLQYRRVAGQKITLEVNFFMFSLKVARQVLTLVYPGTGIRVPPSNENPARAQLFKE